jgi:hypothetical protein
VASTLYPLSFDRNKNKHSPFKPVPGERLVAKICFQGESSMLMLKAVLSVEGWNRNEIMIYGRTFQDWAHDLVIFVEMMSFR